MATIDVLPDDVLLAIFEFYVVRYQDLNPLEAMFDNQDTRTKIQSWQSLVHVCRRWRGLVFASPRHLNLQLHYIPRRSATKTLDIWPALPLLIQGSVSETSLDDVIAEIEQSDRICQINLDFYTTSQIERLWTVMQVPFPELAGLYLSFGTWPYGSVYGPVIPDLFLGGSATRLRFLALNSVPFPGLPKLSLDCHPPRPSFA